MGTCNGPIRDHIRVIERARTELRLKIVQRTELAVVSANSSSWAMRLSRRERTPGRGWARAHKSMCERRSSTLPYGDIASERRVLPTLEPA